MRRILTSLLIVIAVSVSGHAKADMAKADQVADPRIGYFVSETGNRGFTLDRSGERGLLRFDKAVEILVLEMVPGPQGVTYLNDSLGITRLRLMPWGGATAYEADGSEGAAYDLKGNAGPLRLARRSKQETQRRAQEIGQALAADFQLGIQIAFVPDQGLGSVQYAALGDALELAALALRRLAVDELARDVMTERLANLVLRVGEAPAISLVDGTLNVTCVPAEGPLGRLSSARIERFLLENL